MGTHPPWRATSSCAEPQGKEGGEWGWRSPSWRPTVIAGGLLARAGGRGQEGPRCPGWGCREVLCLSEGPQPPSALAFLQPLPGAPHAGVWGHAGDGMLSSKGWGSARGSGATRVGGGGLWGLSSHRTPYSILKRRTTSNPAWSLAAHPCPCPSSHGRQGQGWLRLSAPTLATALTLHGGTRWPRDPPSTTGPQQGLSGWSHSSLPQDLHAQGHARLLRPCHALDSAEHGKPHRDTPGPPPATPARGLWGASSGLSPPHSTSRGPRAPPSCQDIPGRSPPPLAPPGATVPPQPPPQH